MDIERAKFEYSQLLLSYHEYFQLVAKGITIYLVLIGACLTLPNTVRFDSLERQVLFREACRVFAVVITIAAIAMYLSASFGFWSIHRRVAQLAKALELTSSTTWILPVSVWAACVSALLLLVFIGQYF